jgi:hypothetical protein
MCAEHEEDVTRVGLCVRCINVHIIENRRGSRFYRCRLADVDPAFRRYPPLPVISCPGFAPEGEVGPAEVA